MKPSTVLLTSLFVLLGLALTGFGTLRIRKAYATESWNLVEGVSLQATFSSGPGPDRERPCTVVVRYSYEVDGEVYEGNRFNLDGPLQTTYAKGEFYSLKHSKGRPVSVLVHPEDPKESVLAPGGAQRGALFIAMGAALLFLTGWFAVKGPP